MVRNLRKRRGFLFGGGGGKALGPPEGAAGGVVGGGIEVRDVVCTFTLGGGGGTSGTFSGGIVEFELGVGEEGDAGEIEITGPGAGGVGRVVVVLCDPGRTTASELWMLGFEFVGDLLMSARNLYARYQVKLIHALPLPNSERVFHRTLLITVLFPSQRISHCTPFFGATDLFLIAPL